jgi:hypothetical protein
MQTIKVTLFLILFTIATLMACNNTEENQDRIKHGKLYLQETPFNKGSNLDNPSMAKDSGLIRCKALLATRFTNLDEFKRIVQIEYFGSPTFTDTSTSGYSKVLLTYSNNNQEIISELESGINQGDILDVQDADFLGKSSFVLKSPYAVRNRVDLEKIYLLARRRYHIFGEGDVAFFDLAEASARKISTKELAFQNRRDSSEKGYVNTFNHITAQALIATLFSEDLADFMADVHERFHMPELTTGNFTEEQLHDTINYPLDNYVDIVNNEIGQQLGVYLRNKYRINLQTRWSPELLANYMNDLQSYYIWSLGIGMKPFEPSEDLIARFSKKINIVLDGA